MKTVIEQTMDLKRETKGTFRFETENPQQDFLGVVYVRKGAFPSRPSRVTLTLKVDG
jgi:hypothetical protein